MAMIKCPECGREISDKALTCPHCGVPINLRVAIPVVFKREKKSYSSLLKVIVEVDGQVEGALRNGASFETELLPGRHIVNLYCGSGYTANELVIPDGSNEAVVQLAVALRGTIITSVTTR